MSIAIKSALAAIWLLLESVESTYTIGYNIVEPLPRFVDENDI